MGAPRVKAEDAEVVMKAAGLTPVEGFPGTQHPWPCVCDECGRPTSPRYNDIRKGQGGCKPCGYLQVSRTLTKTHAQASEGLAALGLIPMELYPGAHEKWLVECLSCAEQMRITLAHKIAKRRGCPLCSVRARGLASRRSPEEATLLLQGAGFEPSEPYPGNGKPWACVHLACGRETAKRLSDVQTGHKGCFFCAKNGFRFGSPGTLYVLEHEGLGAIKVGVTGQSSGRIEKFEKANWVVVHRANFPLGETAFKIEQRVLRALRKDLSLTPFLRPEDMAGMGGYSETFDKNKATRELVLNIIKNKSENGEEK